MEEIKNLIESIFEAAKDFEGIQLSEEKEDILINSSMTASVYYTEMKRNSFSDFCIYFEMSLNDMIEELTNCLNDLKGLKAEMK